MLKEDYQITSAVRFLREKKITFIPFLYRYEEHGGTALAAAERMALVAEQLARHHASAAGKAEGAPEGNTR